MACFVASLPIKERDSVSGIFFGHTRTQFCALPHPAIPSLPRAACILSVFSKAPVGLALKRRIWDMAAGPIKSDLALTWGHDSLQQPQVMHVERTYIASCTSWEMGGPNCPVSSVPSTEIQPRIFLSASNICVRSTH